jgi:uncharacterized protein
LAFGKRFNARARRGKDAELFLVMSDEIIHGKRRTADDLAVDSGAYSLVFSGAFNSGKSTFIQTIANGWEAIEHENHNSTFGKLIVDKQLALFLHNPPPARRFDLMWAIFEQCLGFVVMVDSADLTVFRENYSILQTFYAYAPLPYVVAANKQDKPSAWSPEDLRIALRIPKDVPVMPCVATDKESVKGVLLALLERVMVTSYEDKFSVKEQSPTRHLVEDPNVYWIVVTGPVSCGSTIFARNISENVGGIDLDGDLNGRHWGGCYPLTIDETTTLCLGVTPEARRFDFMWSILASSRLIGFICLVDSSQPQTFREAKAILETFQAYAPVPHIIAANKQDNPFAWSIEDLRIALRIPKEIPVVPCVATDKESVKGVLLALLERVMAASDE